MSYMGQNVVLCFAVCLCNLHGHASEVTMSSRCQWKKSTRPMFSVESVRICVASELSGFASSSCVQNHFLLSAVMREAF